MKIASQSKVGITSMWQQSVYVDENRYCTEIISLAQWRRLDNNIPIFFVWKSVQYHYKWCFVIFTTEHRTLLSCHSQLPLSYVARESNERKQTQKCSSLSLLDSIGDPDDDKAKQKLWEKPGGVACAFRGEEVRRSRRILPIYIYVITPLAGFPRYDTRIDSTKDRYDDKDWASPVLAKLK